MLRLEFFIAWVAVGLIGAAILYLVGVCLSFDLAAPFFFLRIYAGLCFVWLLWLWLIALDQQRTRYSYARRTYQKIGKP